ncbi:hypothetical protein PR048_005047 [Dryococelus australis]|uniref:Uncharacterized protein n=1 Tax=Dryococelus australis TaxID=614101 RepID=A0ABQ9I750_9NEOP|nr:hypothetical protein PR048_005047 [Dryococelus australis]
MAKQDFRSSKRLEDVITRRRTEPPYKNQSLDCKSAKAGEPTSVTNIIQECLYNGYRHVTQDKNVHNSEKRDMSDLLPFIPPIHHSYFHHLLTTGAHEDRENVGLFTEVNVAVKN